MLVVLNALLPVFVLVGLGYVFAARGFPGDGFWLGAERMAYYVLFPALLVRHLARASVDWSVIGPMALIIAITVLSISALVVLTRHRLAADGPAFSSVFQGSIRFNSFVGLAATASLYPNRGLAIASLVLAILIPLANILSVTVLAHTSASVQARPSVRHVLGQLARNPLILSCIGGIVLNLSGIGLPGDLDRVIAPLDQAALPVGLLVVGSGLNHGALLQSRLPLAVASLFKLILSPIIAVTTCVALGLGGTAAEVVVLFSALPSAPSAYILAGQMGGDRALMAAILTVETALAIFTLPATLTLSRHFIR